MWIETWVIDEPLQVECGCILYMEQMRCCCRGWRVCVCWEDEGEMAVIYVIATRFNSSVCYPRVYRISSNKHLNDTEAIFKHVNRVANDRGQLFFSPTFWYINMLNCIFFI